MKKTITAALILLIISCTKNNLQIAEPITMIDGNIKSIEQLSSSVTKFTYTHSPIVVYEINKSLIRFSLNSNSIDAVAATTLLPGGFTKWVLSSPSGAEYFSFQLDKANRIGKLRVTSDIPFYKLYEGNATQMLSLPTRQTCMALTKTFSSCMSCAAKECFSDWKCAFVCSGAWIAACAGGWAIGCALSVHVPEPPDDTTKDDTTLTVKDLIIKKDSATFKLFLP